MFIDMYNTLDMNKFEEIISETEKDIGRELPFKRTYASTYEYLRDRVLQKNKTLRLKQ